MTSTIDATSAVLTSSSGKTLSTAALRQRLASRQARLARMESADSVVMGAIDQLTGEIVVLGAEIAARVERAKTRADNRMFINLAKATRRAERSARRQAPAHTLAALSPAQVEFIAHLAVSGCTKPSYSRGVLRQIALKGGWNWAPAWIVKDETRRDARGFYNVPELTEYLALFPVTQPVSIAAMDAVTAA